MLAGLLLPLLLASVFTVCGAAAAEAGTPHRTAPSATSADSHADVSGTLAAADDAGPSRCHKSKGEGGGALPAAPSAGQQQSLALPACPAPESHTAIGAAHERPPVRGPAPAPPPTPVELSVLRV